jgi:hypothetical protein
MPERRAGGQVAKVRDGIATSGIEDGIAGFAAFKQILHIVSEYLQFVGRMNASSQAYSGMWKLITN